MTDWWRTARYDVSVGLLQLQDNAIGHPANMSRSPLESPPPSVRIGMMALCSQLDPVSPQTSEIPAKFLTFLGQ